MKYTKNLVIIGPMIFLFLYSNVFGVNRKELIQKILSNEEKFKRTIIEYTQDTYSESKKESEKEPVPISPTIESTFSSNGHLQRLDSAYDDLRGEKIRYRKVSTGEVYSDWNFSEIDMEGHATIEPATKFSDSMFPLKHFCPFTYYNGNKNDISLSVENGKIHLSWQDTESNQNIEGVYRLEGESVLPVEYIVVNPLPGGKEEIAVQLSYEYKNTSLSQITICHPPHNIKISRTIKSIDFNPNFSAGHFEIIFTDGTWVFDKTLNAKYRYRRSFPMHLYFDEEQILGDSNHSVDKKEDILSELPSDEHSSKELDQVVKAFKSQSAENLKKTNNHKIKHIYLYVVGIITAFLVVAYKYFLVKRKVIAKK
jgi:hypothetical protein